MEILIGNILWDMTPLLRSKDYHMAVQWLKKSAKKNCGDAMCDLGKVFFFGLGVEKDFNAALFWLDCAQDYETDDPVSKKIYNILCGYSNNMLDLGLTIMANEPVLEQEGWNIVKQEAERGNGIALFEIAIKSEDIPTMISWLKKSRNSGYKKSDVELAILYLGGHNISEPDLESDVMHIIEREATSEPMLALQLVLFYLKGYSEKLSAYHQVLCKTEKNVEKAAKLLVKACHMHTSTALAFINESPAPLFSIYLAETFPITSHWLDDRCYTVVVEIYCCISEQAIYKIGYFPNELILAIVQLIIASSEISYRRGHDIYGFFKALGHEQLYEPDIYQLMMIDDNESIRVGSDDEDEGKDDGNSGDGDTDGE
jgi:TPR repeat protein